MGKEQSAYRGNNGWGAMDEGARAPILFEIDEICRSLVELLDSCSEHEVTMDALVAPADPKRYHTALEKISRHISIIRESGISREELAGIAIHGLGSGKEPVAGIIDVLALVPLMGGGITAEEASMVGRICRDWAWALAPPDPVELEETLRSAARPLTLPDILSPDITRMQRFPTILLLESAGRDLPPFFWSNAAAGGWIPLPLGVDRATFCAKVSRAVYCYLVHAHSLPGTHFPGLVHQAIGDLGIIGSGGDGGVEIFLKDSPPLTAALFTSGQAIRQCGEARDVRVFYRAADSIIQSLSTGEREMVQPDLEQCAGHVLAGFACGQGKGDSTSDEPHGPTSNTSSSLPRIFLDFLREAASQPSGRAQPGPDLVRSLDETVREIRHLLNVLTGKYSWRCFPFTQGSARIFPLEVINEREVLVYDPRDLAYMERESALALAIEAYYRSIFGFRPPIAMESSLPKSWISLLFAVTGNHRAVRKGLAVHPGAATWLNRFYSLVSGEPDFCADRARVHLLPPADQFLAEVLLESRVGIRPDTRRSPAVQLVLDGTRNAREKVSNLHLTDQECQKIVMDEILPLCAPLFVQEPVSGKTTGRLPGRPEAPHPGIVPLSSVSAFGLQVPGPHAPRANTAGKILSGRKSGFLDDEEYKVPITSAHEGTAQDGGTGTPRPDMREERDGEQVPGHVSEGPRRNSDSVKDIASRFVRECQESSELLDTLASGGVSRDRGSPDTCRQLGRSARHLESMADRIKEDIRNLGPAASHGSPPGPESGGDRGKRGEEWNALLTLSRDICRAARKYRKMATALEHMAELPGMERQDTGSRIGMTREALSALQEKGAEFQRVAGTVPEPEAGEWQARVRLPETAGGNTSEAGELPATGRLEPAFVPDAVSSPELWESFSYFDAIYGDDREENVSGSSSSRISRDTTEKRFEQEKLALTREAEQYLTTLRERTRSEWETLDESAERVRQVALYEYLAVGQDDYALYQRFYQPVAGLVGVARKNIQQAFQKDLATLDLTELATGDDIDEENLAAVRTTMRIFKETGRQEDKARWTISLLVDASSSMHDETVSKKLDATLQAVVLFGEALSHVTGIRFEIAAFTDSEYIPLKRYQDDWTIQQGCFCIRQVIHASGGTNDVGAVGSALDRMARLRDSQGKNRMIFLISDGQSGVGGRTQMKEILSRHNDIRIFAWGVGPDMEMIEDTYRPYGTWVHDIADLPRSLGEVLRRELGRPAMAGWKSDSPGHVLEEDICSN